MHHASKSLTVWAIPPLVGSLVVLHLASVGKLVWISHIAAIALAGALAWSVSHLGRRVDQHIAALTLILLTVVGLMIPLLEDRSGPDRWASIGPLKLYLAPMLLPAFIGAFSYLVQRREKSDIAVFAGCLIVAALLALQPDASQALGLLVASSVVALQYRLGALRAAILLLPLVAVTGWAFSIPDPLQPVPHVEEVFKLALSHSYFAGIAVIASALTLIVGLWSQSRVGPAWLSAVAAYYAVLFGCSIAGLTPAPLVGYGAGPILGFGLMVGLLGCFDSPAQAAVSSRPE